MHSKTNEPFHHTGKKYTKNIIFPHHWPSDLGELADPAAMVAAIALANASGCVPNQWPCAMAPEWLPGTSEMKIVMIDVMGSFEMIFPHLCGEIKTTILLVYITVVRAVRAQAVYRSIPKSPNFYQWRSIVLVTLSCHCQDLLGNGPKKETRSCL